MFLRVLSNFLVVHCECSEFVLCKKLFFLKEVRRSDSIRTFRRASFNRSQNLPSKIHSKDQRCPCVVFEFTSTSILQSSPNCVHFEQSSSKLSLALLSRPLFSIPKLLFLPKIVPVLSVWE